MSLPLPPAATCSEPYEEQGLWPHLQGAPPPRGTSRGPQLDRTLAHTRPRAALPGPTRSAASCAVAPRIIFYLPGKGSLPRPLLCTPVHVPPVMCCVLRCERERCFGTHGTRKPPLPPRGQSSCPAAESGARSWVGPRPGGTLCPGGCCCHPSLRALPPPRPSAALGHITPTFQRPGKSWPWARPPLCVTVVTTGGGGGAEGAAACDASEARRGGRQQGAQPRAPGAASHPGPGSGATWLVAGPPGLGRRLFETTSLHSSPTSSEGVQAGTMLVASPGLVLGFPGALLKRRNRREFRNQTVLIKQNNEFIPSMSY